MTNLKSISFKMAVLQWCGQNLPPQYVCIQKTPCGMGLSCSTLPDFLTETSLIILTLNAHHNSAGVFIVTTISSFQFSVVI